MISKTILHVTDLHRSQSRKISKLPYIVHPLAVASKVLSYKYQSKTHDTETLYIAALLHDTVEDCNITTDEIKTLYGDQVGDLVAELTNDQKQITEFKYILENDTSSKYPDTKYDAKTLYLIHKMFKMSDEAFYIKLCDRLDNIQSDPTSDYVNSTINIMSYLLKSSRHISVFHAAIIQDIMKLCITYNSCSDYSVLADCLDYQS